MTIMAMGITPYINASIIMQLLAVAIPALERLSKDGGEEGRKKINKITRYVTVALAILQSVGIIMTLNRSMQVLNPDYNNFWGYTLIALVMAGGTALAMWIGERITKNGIGNGISLLIFVGIVSNLFNGILQAILGLFTDNASQALVHLIVILLTTIVIVALVTFVDMAERRIKVQYAKRVVGRKMYGGQSTHIPMKLLAVGVLPLIFAYSFMSFPGTIMAMINSNSGAYKWWEANMNQSSWLYAVICALLIIGFSYFYTAITFNAEDISKNVQQQGGHIPGVRSGAATTMYLNRTSKRLTLFAALFLAILATVPTFVWSAAKVTIPFGASSILIAVQVALETMRQLEAQMVVRHYKGFL
jgi:preprotein translocase subunit SecY